MFHAPYFFRSTKRLKLDHSRISGLLFALCCHHCCSWGSYVGREFLENLGFSPYYFHILCCLSSWATCGSRKEAPGKLEEDVSSEISAGSSSQHRASETASEEDGGTKEEPEENTDCSSDIKDGQEHSTVVDEGSCIKYVAAFLF